MIQLRENEEIRKIKRRHPIALLMEIFFLALFFLAGIIAATFIFFTPFSLPEILTEHFPILLSIQIRFLILYFISIALLILWQIGFLLFANYYLDCWIITNERTIHTELKSIFNRHLASVPHNTIQDITVNVVGFFPTFLKYGDLQIQTAGKFQEFIFKQIPEPYQTKEIIFKAQREYLINQRASVENTEHNSPPTNNRELIN